MSIYPNLLQSNTVFTYALNKEKCVAILQNENTACIELPVSIADLLITLS